MDGDGDVDLVIGGHLDVLAWLENDGNGAFRERHAISRQRSVSAVHTADVDGDGDRDVLAVVGNGIEWFENWGGGVFSEANTISTGRHDAVHAVDFDADGDMDVLTTARGGSHTVVWFENAGAGEFGEGQAIDTYPSVIDRDGYAVVPVVHPADLNADGDMDVVSAVPAADGVAGRLVWYENQGDGAFSGPAAIDTALGDDDGNSPTLNAADLDGDGDMDILLSVGPHLRHQSRVVRK